MLRKAAAGLRARMIDNGVEAPSVDVIVYAMNIVANTLSIVVLSLLAGLLTGEFGRTVLVLGVFALIRYLSGGYHLKSGLWCIVVSSAVMSVIPHIHLSDNWTSILTAIALVVVILLAPANYDKYATIDPKYFPLMKVISSLVVASNFVFMSDVMALAFITQAGLLPFKEGGEQG